ncbi:hypothetical protein HYR99_08615, partial [Candidatus Poribacteria bacterium]|nr:hypothetical protein [Candidatus Poribacteria bacterium]
VSISIYDARGSLIRQLQPGVQAAGSYLTPEKAAYWDGRDLHGEPVSSGVYFYRLDAEEFSATRKMILVK